MKRSLAVTNILDAVDTEAARIGASVHLDVIATGYSSNAWRVFAMPDGSPAAVLALAAWLEAKGWQRSAIGPDTFETIVVATE